MHPIALTVSGNGAESTSWSPWWVVDGSIEMTLEAKAEEKKPLPMTVLGLLLDYPILFIPIFALFALLAVGALRTKNSMGMDLDIFDDEEDVEATEIASAEEIDDVSIEDEEFHSEEHQDVEPIRSETKVDKTRKKPHQEPNPEEGLQTPVVRRRTAKVKESKEGPITTVKRRRLDNRSCDEPTVKKKATRKKVVTKAPVRKTRRVVTQADKEVEDSPGER